MVKRHFWDTLKNSIFPLISPQKLSVTFNNKKFKIPFVKFNRFKTSSVEFDKRKINKVCVNNEGIIFCEKTVKFSGNIKFLRVSQKCLFTIYLKHLIILFDIHTDLN